MKARRIHLGVGAHRSRPVAGTGRRRTTTTHKEKAMTRSSARLDIRVRRAPTTNGPQLAALTSGLIAVAKATIAGVVLRHVQAG
jgi:hypothetical protein